MDMTYQMLANETLDYIAVLEREFSNNANRELALQQGAYLRNQFQFFGISTQKRRAIQSPFLHKSMLPPKRELNILVKLLWKKDEREFHYFAQELSLKYMKVTEKEDIHLYVHMVAHQSWWDTVDMIANKLMGNYFLLFPEERQEHIDKWLQSNNIWLQRSALLFQLKYKEKMDLALLVKCIHHLSGSNEFFINKAIGWVLREYSRIDPAWVKGFVSETALNSLSKREALRLVS
ncbi:DNA alkylation repair protein [uncultured Cyclobacterium sp.]|uniref:DNA alkylation repair protein n=1 Tax=uncultured Cyclobacterium sp. TaxID=453820 RepID=UPI0030EF44F8|tara:strand:- start:294717 stop:295418 length:702 start_codon:yes stop_codon:yes gene_type:complete